MPQYLIESTAYGITGLLVGAFVDSSFKKLSAKYPKYKYLFAVVQLITLIILIALFYMYASKRIALDFQKTLSGMTFPAMYFGVQSNIFEIGQSLFN